MAKGKKEQIKELLLEQRKLEMYFKDYGYVPDLDDALYEDPELRDAYDRWNDIDDKLMGFNEKTVREVRKWM